MCNENKIFDLREISRNYRAFSIFGLRNFTIPLSRHNSITPGPICLKFVYTAFLWRADVQRKQTILIARNFAKYRAFSFFGLRYFNTYQHSIVTSYLNNPLSDSLQICMHGFLMTRDQQRKLNFWIARNFAKLSRFFNFRT